MLQRVESFILEQSKHAMLRIETSTQKVYACARSLYVRQGLKEAGRIPDFYAPGDDLVTFYKNLEVAKIE